MPRVTTGLAVVDYALGGGLPRGMITETYGPESTGKTTFYLQVAAANQALDPNWRVLFLDYEQTLDREYARDGLGVIMDRPRFILAQPSTIEEGALIAKTLMAQGLVNQVIWDTPAASQPAETIKTPLTDKELKKGYKSIEAGKSDTGRIGIHAQVFSYALASLVPVIAEKGIVFCFPNQLRTTINTWGAGETTSGGRALKFYAAIRIRLSKTETVKESVADTFLGTTTQTAVETLVQFRIVKNKTAPPERVVLVRQFFGRGFGDRETLFDLAVKRGIIGKAGGGNFTLPGGKAIRGTGNVLAYWEESPDEYAKVKAALYDIALQNAQDLVEDQHTESAESTDFADDDPEVDVPEGRVSI